MEIPAGVFPVPALADLPFQGEFHGHQSLPDAVVELLGDPFAFVFLGG